MHRISQETAGLWKWKPGRLRSVAEKNSTRVSARVLPMCSTIDDYHDKI